MQDAFIDWISDTLSQGYTNLQSFWIIGVLHRIQYAVKQDCVGLHNLRWLCRIRGHHTQGTVAKVESMAIGREQYDWQT